MSEDREYWRQLATAAQRQRRMRLILGLVAVLALGCALVVPSPWSTLAIVIGLFSGVGIGWVE